eukprot:GHVN01005527.1.p1 GENE.GHVN01005527.1~~GHVN01005527.1.p1  ORF type:complete len:1350 (+),score=284.56 GHVN01005527.1:159-4208(+)
MAQSPQQATLNGSALDNDTSPQADNYPSVTPTAIKESIDRIQPDGGQVEGTEDSSDSAPINYAQLLTSSEPQSSSQDAHSGDDKIAALSPQNDRGVGCIKAPSSQDQKCESDTMVTSDMVPIDQGLFNNNCPQGSDGQAKRQNCLNQPLASSYCQPLKSASQESSLTTSNKNVSSSFSLLLQANPSLTQRRLTEASEYHQTDRRPSLSDAFGDRVQLPSGVGGNPLQSSLIRGMGKPVQEMGHVLVEGQASHRGQQPWGGGGARWGGERSQVSDGYEAPGGGMKSLPFSGGGGAMRFGVPAARGDASGASNGMMGMGKVAGGFTVGIPNEGEMRAGGGVAMMGSDGRGGWGFIGTEEGDGWGYGPGGDGVGKLVGEDSLVYEQHHQQHHQHHHRQHHEHRSHLQFLNNRQPNFQRTSAGRGGIDDHFTQHPPQQPPHKFPIPLPNQYGNPHNTSLGDPLDGVNAHRPAHLQYLGGAISSRQGADVPQGGGYNQPHHQPPHHIHQMSMQGNEWANNDLSEWHRVSMLRSSHPITSSHGGGQWGGKRGEMMGESPLTQFSNEARHPWSPQTQSVSPAHDGPQRFPSPSAGERSPPTQATAERRTQGSDKMKQGGPVSQVGQRIRRIGDKGVEYFGWQPGGPTESRSGGGEEAGNGGGGSNSLSPPGDLITSKLSDTTGIGGDGATVMDCRGRMAGLAKIQAGSRYLQRQLGKGSKEIISMVFEELEPEIVSLMTDPYANYLCQQLFHGCSAPQRRKLTERIAPSAVEISCDRRGTHSLQTLIQQLTTREEEAMLVDQIKDKVLDLAMDTHGTHVVQRMLICFKPPTTDVIFEKVIQNLSTVAQCQHGLCVVKKCISSANKSHQYESELLEQLTKHAQDLMQSPYGNYAIQHAMDVWGGQVCQSLVHELKLRLISLSTQKFSSNVVEKCIETATASDLAAILREIGDVDKMSILINSPYGNFVVRKALEAGNREQQSYLQESIRRNIRSHQNKKIKTKWERVVVEVADGNNPQHSRFGDGLNRTQMRNTQTPHFPNGDPGVLNYPSPSYPQSLQEIEVRGHAGGWNSPPFLGDGGHHQAQLQGGTSPYPANSHTASSLVNTRRVYGQGQVPQLNPRNGGYSQDEGMHGRGKTEGLGDLWGGGGGGGWGGEVNQWGGRLGREGQQRPMSAEGINGGYFNQTNMSVNQNNMNVRGGVAWVGQGAYGMGDGKGIMTRGSEGVIDGLAHVDYQQGVSFAHEPYPLIQQMNDNEYPAEHLFHPGYGRHEVINHPLRQTHDHDHNGHNGFQHQTISQPSPISPVSHDFNTTTGQRDFFSQQQHSLPSHHRGLLSSHPTHTYPMGMGNTHTDGPLWPHN